MVSLLITIIILGLIFAVIWWAITQIPMPAPFGMVVRVIFALVVVVVLLGILMGGIGDFGSFGNGHGLLGNGYR